MAKPERSEQGRSADSSVQPAAEVARRCLVLFAVVLRAQGERRTRVQSWLKRERLSKFASPHERRFLQATSPKLRDRAFASWRIEALYPLLWALHCVPKLPPPSDRVSSLRGLLPRPGDCTLDFVQGAKLRSYSVLDRERERVYRQHWKVRDAELNGRRPPRGLDPEVVMQRHWALNWLLNDDGEPWDEVATDT